MGVREPKLSGWRKMQVCRHIAERKYTNTQIAEMYDVTEAAVRAFAGRNADIIEEIRNNIEDEFAGMWIAQKKNRIAYLMNQAEMIGDALSGDVELDGALLRAAQSALKNAAEELGQLPSRLTVVTPPSEFRYTVVGEGVDPSDVT